MFWWVRISSVGYAIYLHTYRSCRDGMEVVQIIYPRKRVLPRGYARTPSNDKTFPTDLTERLSSLMENVQNQQNSRVRGGLAEPSGDRHSNPFAGKCYVKFTRSFKEKKRVREIAGYSSGYTKNRAL